MPPTGAPRPGPTTQTPPRTLPLSLPDPEDLRAVR
jgi:hypothetical protein